MNPNAPAVTTPFLNTIEDVKTNTNMIGICPVQKVNLEDKDGNLVEALAMIDSGSNSSFLAKSTAKKLGLQGTRNRLTINLAGGERKSEQSELVEVHITPVSDPHVKKTINAYTIHQTSSPAKTVSRKAV